MNWAHLHLIINHLPLFGICIGLMLHGVGVFKGSDNICKIALWVFIFTGLITFPVYFSGDYGEEQFSNLPDTAKQFLENHEDLAGNALIGTSVLGVLAFVGILLYSQLGGRKGIFLRVFMLVALAVAVIMAQTANLGAKILHSEIRDDYFIWRETKTRQ